MSMKQPNTQDCMQCEINFHALYHAPTAHQQNTEGLAATQQHQVKQGWPAILTHFHETSLDKAKPFPFQLESLAVYNDLFDHNPEFSIKKPWTWLA
jgi:hypothetical protein